MKLHTISFVPVALIAATVMSAQTLKDRNAAKLRTDNPRVHSNAAVTVPPLHIPRSAISPTPARPVSIDKQLSAMEKQTQKILATPAPRRKASAPPAFKLKPEAKTKGFDAAPYLHNQKPLTATNPAGRNYASRSPIIRGPGH